MHSTPPGRLVAVGLIALFLCCSVSLAENDDGTIEVGAFFSFVRFDPDFHVTPTFAPTVLASYNFTKRHAGEFLFTTLSSAADQGPSLHVDADIIRIGYTFNSYSKEKRVPFFRAGIGLLQLDVSGTFTGDSPDTLDDPSDDVFIYGGGGYRWFINRKWAVRLAGTLDFLEGSNGYKDAQIQGTADIGVVYLFGTRDVRPLTEPIEDDSDTE